MHVRIDYAKIIDLILIHTHAKIYNSMGRLVRKTKKKEKERDCKVCAQRHGQNEVTLDLPVVRSRQDAPLEKLW